MADFDFLKRIPASQESDFEARSKPIPFQVPDGTAADDIIAGLKALHPGVEAKFDKGASVLSVFLPPRIRIGNEPIDLRELAAVLKWKKDIEDLGFGGGDWEHCCGDGQGCCVNKG